MTGSTPERKISFVPLQSNVMALAVSADSSAVLRVVSAVSGPVQEVPAAPVWVTVPSAMLQSAEGLPAGTRMFARSLARADAVTLSLLPQDNRFSAQLNVRCRNEHDAAELAGQLSGTTTMLRDMIQREHQSPNPADLSGILTAGVFHSEGSRVLGEWPIGKAFLDNLLTGNIN
jgi:hypothetical protein